MILDNKQIRLLELLEKQISECMLCPEIRRNGQCLPYWTPFSEYLIIGEAPGRDEVNEEPFIGVTGRKLWQIMSELGLRKEQFCIINTIQCRPMVGNRNGKPTPEYCRNCYPWIRKFIKVIQPEKGILFGNYAKSLYDGRYSGILYSNSRKANLILENKFPKEDFHIDVIMSVHPSMMIYKGEEGEKLIIKSLEAFKEL